MAAARWTAVLLSTTLACGLIVDVERFRPSPDAGSDAGSLPPRALRVEPQRLPEGTGGPPTTGRGAVLVFSGPQFEAETTIQSEDPRVTLSPPNVSSNGRWAAVRVWIGVDPDLAVGETSTVALAVDFGANEVFEVILQIDGLDELSLGGIVPVEDLEPVYSEIVTANTTTFVGDTPVRLRSTGRLHVRHQLLAAADGSTPGPGGQAGGQAGVDGNGLRGGSAGDMRENGCAGGGGGAGARLPGEMGGRGAAGGTAGPPQPRRLSDAERLVGHGGGGGGDRRESIGGRGGGGGGSVWLFASTLLIDATIDVRGAHGEAPANAGCGSRSGLGAGGGGGGSGGFVFLSALDTLSWTGNILIDGGTGGGGGANVQSGGEGSPGWLRVDAPQVPDGPSLWRGPAWAIDDPIVAPEQPIGVRGTAAESLRLWLDDVFDRVVVLDDTGFGEIIAPRTAGLHRLCLSAEQTLVEYEPCVSIAVLP